MLVDLSIENKNQLHLYAPKTINTMASWANGVPSGASTRRRWNLEDRASLHKLKTHIAEEGCPDVQFDLAKELLNSKIEPNSDVQAVRWLICAAQQGHEDAAKLLRKCHEQGNGITRENVDEVRYCLTMTPGERAARKAARELFACLSNGGEHITPKQLERRMRRIYNLQRKRRRRNNVTASTNTTDDDSDSECEPLENGVNTQNGDGHTLHTAAGVRRSLITEANLVSAASRYAAGLMPDVNDALTLSAPHPEALDHVPCFHRMIFHPVIFFTLLYHRFLNFACGLPGALPVSARFGLVILVYLMCSGDRNTSMLPLFTYYFSLAVMVWSTCKMLKTKQEFIDFRIWSGLFLSYGDHNIEADISENRFLRNNMKPYFCFFCAFVCNLIVYPLVANEWLPHSELTMISGAFIFVSMIAFMYGSTYNFPDWIILVSFAVNVLAKYPYELDDVVSNRWRFLDLRVPTFPSFVIGNGIEFCLNCRTALYLLIPLLLAHLAKRSNWHGVYTYLIPHCVTLSWLQVCIATSQSATVFGVIRATLGMAGIVLFLPLFGIVSLLIPVFVAIDWMGFTDPNLRWGSTAVAFILTVLTSCFLALNRVTQKYITVCQILIALVAASVLVFPYMTSSFKDSQRFGTIGSLNTNITSRSTLHEAPNLRGNDELSWERFYLLCIQPANDQSNKIKSQLRCAHLRGMSVAWRGVVSQVKIAHVTNIRDDLINKYLPRWLANVIRCVYGDPINEQLDCNPDDDKLCNEWKRIVESIQHKTGHCSLHRWNRYEYELQVKTVPNSPLVNHGEVVLLASHEFGNFTHRLVKGDSVNFYGELRNSRQIGKNEQIEFMLGSNVPPQVQLKSIACEFCKDPEILSVSIEKQFKSAVDARLQDLMRGIKYLLNALLNPLIIFR